MVGWIDAYISERIKLHSCFSTPVELEKNVKSSFRVYARYNFIEEGEEDDDEKKIGFLLKVPRTSFTI